MYIATLHRGTLPLLISLPHDGSHVPDDFAARMQPEARGAPDTDWHVSRLYAFAADMGASLLVPTHSRYVVDLNRPPDDVSLYPGQNSTGLCPALRFSGDPVYLSGHEPSAADVDQRVELYWKPYHALLAGEIERMLSEHGRALLWEGHSIRSRVPFLFEGRLPDLNLGTAGGNSCRPETQTRLEAVLRVQYDYTWIANGRFKGGYITRQYGQPERGVQAVQLELAQCNYMDEDSFAWDETRAARLQPMLRALLQSFLD
ncbi:N-formylglutamate deformylase [soil metagenome]